MCILYILYYTIYNTHLCPRYNITIMTFLRKMYVRHLCRRCDLNRRRIFISSHYIILNRFVAFSISNRKQRNNTKLYSSILYEIFSLFFILFYSNYSYFIVNTPDIFIFVGVIDEWMPVRILCSLNDAHIIIGTEYHEFNIFNRNAFIRVISRHLLSDPS